MIEGKFVFNTENTGVMETKHCPLHKSQCFNCTRDSKISMTHWEVGSDFCKYFRQAKSSELSSNFIEPNEINVSIKCTCSSSIGYLKDIENEI